MSDAHHKRQVSGGGRITALMAMLLIGAQVTAALPHFRTELTHLAISAQLTYWKSSDNLPDPLELDAAYYELETAIARTPGWAELYVARAEVSLQSINFPDVPEDIMDMMTASAYADLDAAGALIPTWPRVPLVQLGLDSLLLRAGGADYAAHASEVQKLSRDSRIYLQPALKILMNDWDRLSPPTQALTMDGLERLAASGAQRAHSLVRQSPHSEQICATSARICNDVSAAEGRSQTENAELQP